MIWFKFNLNQIKLKYCCNRDNNILLIILTFSTLSSSAVTSAVSTATRFFVYKILISLILALLLHVGHLFASLLHPV